MKETIATKLFSKRFDGDPKRPINYEQLTKSEIKELVKHYAVKEQKLLNKFGTVSNVQDVKKAINQHKINNTIMYMSDHNEAFKYLKENDYSVDIVATYSEGVQEKYRNKICINNLYMLVRETGECIYTQHAWLYSDSVENIVHKYFYKYGPGRIDCGEVFISRMKTMPYVSYYGGSAKQKGRFQLTNLCKTARAEIIRKTLLRKNIEITHEEARALL